MTIFLRNNKNQTIVDIEFNDSKKGMDLHAAVEIDTYSKLLLDNLNRKEEVIEDFNNISQLRGWFWEIYMELTDEPTFNDAIAQIKNKLIPIAEKYKLNYVTD